MNLLILIPFLVLMACSKKDDTHPTSQGATAPTSEGTGSLGGGGNGIDEKMLESYAVSIETLPEYRRYIEPIIRKIGRGGGDILTKYMMWGIKQKIWYMIPRPLTDLSHEQVGTGFETTQYALNNDARVYIARATYAQMDHKERANLLMHEIVMSAKLLMKKTPQEQCEKLSDVNGISCSDPETMKIAEAVDVSDADRGTMDTPDHDAVRAMTIFLMQHPEDVSGAAVYAKRRELGFIYPWDKALSNLSINDVRLALERSKLSGEKLVANPSLRHFTSPTPVRCEFWDNASNEDEMSLHISAILDQELTGAFDINKAPKEWQPAIFTSTYLQDPSGQWIQHYAVEFEAAAVDANLEEFEAQGKLDPADPKKIIDVVHIRPNPSSEEISSSSARLNMRQIELFISRESVPRILRIGVRKLAIQMLKPDQDWRTVSRDDWNWVVNVNEQFSCTPTVGNLK